MLIASKLFVSYMNRKKNTFFILFDKSHTIYITHDSSKSVKIIFKKY